MKQEIEMELLKKEFELQKEKMLKEYNDFLNETGNRNSFEFKYMSDKYNPEGMLSFNTNGNMNGVFINQKENKINVINNYCREDVRYQQQWIAINKMVIDNKVTFKETLDLGFKLKELEIKINNPNEIKNKNKNKNKPK
jgi:hypothetical protein